MGYRLLRERERGSERGYKGVPGGIDEVEREREKIRKRREGEEREEVAIEMGRDLICGVYKVNEVCPYKPIKRANCSPRKDKKQTRPTSYNMGLSVKTSAELLFLFEQDLVVFPDDLFY